MGTDGAIGCVKRLCWPFAQAHSSETNHGRSFDIQRIEGDTKDSGFYLLIAQPSPLRPHGVIAGEGFR
jgi:hypothetical protein